MKEISHDTHGITCNCERCIGLRLYPQPSHCTWCHTTHAGNSNNCPNDSSGDDPRDIDWKNIYDPKVEKAVQLALQSIRAMTRRVRQLAEQKESNNMSLKAMADSRSNGQAGNLLKGSDVPARVKSITITVEQIREAPEGFTAPAIIDLKTETFGANAWAVNKTNLKAIMKHFGDDEKKIRGKKIKLDVISVRNPSNGEIVPSLAVSPRQ